MPSHLLSLSACAVPSLPGTQRPPLAFKPRAPEFRDYPFCGGNSVHRSTGDPNGYPQNSATPPTGWHPFAPAGLRRGRNGLNYRGGKARPERLAAPVELAIGHRADNAGHRQHDDDDVVVDPATRASAVRTRIGQIGALRIVLRTRQLTLRVLLVLRLIGSRLR